MRRTLNLLAPARAVARKQSDGVAKAVPSQSESLPATFKEAPRDVQCLSHQDKQHFEAHVVEDNPSMEVSAKVRAPLSMHLTAAQHQVPGTGFSEITRALTRTVQPGSKSPKLCCQGRFFIRVSFSWPSHTGRRC